MTNYNLKKEVEDSFNDLKRRLDLKTVQKELKQAEDKSKLSKANILALKKLWLEQNGKECLKCQSKENITLDHIIPVDIAKQFGIEEERSYMPENYQPLCKRCNMFKGNRLDFANKKTKEILIKLLEKI